MPIVVTAQDLDPKLIKKLEREDFGLEAIRILGAKAFDSDGALVFDRRTPPYLPTVASFLQPAEIPDFRPTLEEIQPSAIEFTPKDFASIYLFGWPPIIRLMPVLRIARRLRSVPVDWLENMLEKSLMVLNTIKRFYDILPHTRVQHTFLGALFRAVLSLSADKQAKFMAAFPIPASELEKAPALPLGLCLPNFTEYEFREPAEPYPLSPGLFAHLQSIKGEPIRQLVAALADPAQNMAPSLTAKIVAAAVPLVLMVSKMPERYKGTMYRIYNSIQYYSTAVDDLAPLEEVLAEAPKDSTTRSHVPAGFFIPNVSMVYKYVYPEGPYTLREPAAFPNFLAKSWKAACSRFWPQVLASNKSPSPSKVYVQVPPGPSRMKAKGKAPALSPPPSITTLSKGSVSATEASTPTLRTLPKRQARDKAEKERAERKEKAASKSSPKRVPAPSVDVYGLGRPVINLFSSAASASESEVTQDNDPTFENDDDDEEEDDDEDDEDDKALKPSKRKQGAAESVLHPLIKRRTRGPSFDPSSEETPELRLFAPTMNYQGFVRLADNSAGLVARFRCMSCRKRNIICGANGVSTRCEQCAKKHREWCEHAATAQETFDSINEDADRLEFSNKMFNVYIDAAVRDHDNYIDSRANEERSFKRSLVSKARLVVHLRQLRDLYGEKALPLVHRIPKPFRERYLDALEQIDEDFSAVIEENFEATKSEYESYVPIDDPVFQRAAFIRFIDSERTDEELNKAFASQGREQAELESSSVSRASTPSRRVSPQLMDIDNQPSSPVGPAGEDSDSDEGVGMDVVKGDR
ncbi:hypothetical protein C8R46DRAFT_1048175 [Mycena filopes]|nr:hypothetical protein C8R46DRAFT_1048175 [Mycena filopes]